MNIITNLWTTVFDNFLYYTSPYKLSDFRLDITDYSNSSVLKATTIYADNFVFSNGRLNVLFNSMFGYRPINNINYTNCSIYCKGIRQHIYRIHNKTSHSIGKMKFTRSNGTWIFEYYQNT